MHLSCNIQSVDEKKAFENMVELVSHMPSETVWAMYSCASGLVRGELEVAIKYLIEKGNTALSAKFPALRS